MLSAITKPQIKYVKALQLKKNRYKEQCFVVEGAKNVLEYLKSDFELKYLIGSHNFYQSFQSKLNLPFDPLLVAKVKDIERMGSLKTNKSCIAVFKMKPVIQSQNIGKGLTMMLDSINDPGNMGALIRVADWYGIQSLICSKQCADPYHPKVIQASMGSSCRVDISIGDLTEILKKQQVPAYGAVLDGTPLETISFSSDAIILIGSESHGISEELLPFITHSITIERYGNAESLNAAVAAGIIIDHFKRAFNG